MKRTLAAIALLTALAYGGIMTRGNPQFIRLRHGEQWSQMVWDVTNHITAELTAYVDLSIGMNLSLAIYHIKG